MTPSKHCFFFFFWIWIFQNNLSNLYSACWNYCKLQLHHPHVPQGSIQKLHHSMYCPEISSKVEKILKDCLELIPSPPPSVKIQIMGRKVCLRCKGKTLLGIVNKLMKTKSLLTSPSNVLPYYLK